ncbi:MAG: 30S ribosome-binding factor RbfA [Alphaproteobacteria bacterium]|nr:30S ribosome-binding factor RbfA [Alphaproteobacteria bacterium]
MTRATSSTPSVRMLRVGELLRHAVSDLLVRNEIIDPALDGVFITVPEVRMTPDLKLASVYVMPLGGANAPEVVEALNRHKKYIRGQLGPALDLKFTPQVRFLVDETFDEAGRIDALLRSSNVQRDLNDDS